MCLSTVYNTDNNGRKQIMANVCNVEIKDGKIYMFDILGRSTEFKGQIRKLDFMNNEIELSSEN